MASGTGTSENAGRGSGSDVVSAFAAFDTVKEALALGHAAALRNAEPNHVVGREECVWHALKAAMATLARLPDREAGWLYAQRSCMPEAAFDYREQLAAFESVKRRIEAGEIAADYLAGRISPPSPRSITRMDGIFDWWQHLQGRNRARDWKILCRLAAGQKAASIAGTLRVSARLVYERREFQCTAIAKGLAARFGNLGELFPPELPPLRTSLAKGGRAERRFS